MNVQKQREAVPAMQAVDWDNGTWGIQQWLERSPWRTLKDTRYGRPVAGVEAIPEVYEDPLLRQVYLMDLALFVGAERTSYLAVSGMMAFAPDEVCQMQLGSQVLDECRHYEIFCQRMAELGVDAERRNALVKRHTTPSLRKFYDLIHEQVDKRDFVASSVAQNLILEGMAYPVYRYEIKYWSRFDPGLSKMIAGAFADEVHHVGFGEAFNSSLLRRSSVEERNRLNKVVREFHQLMSEAFDEVIRFYVGLYQECANQYVSLVGDVEIFRGRKLADTTEEEQVRILLSEIQREHAERLVRIGLSSS